MEAVELPLLFCIGCPRLTAIQEGGDDAGVVHSNLCPHSEFGLLPDAGGQASESG